MAKTYPKENLLRAPVEGWTAIFSFTWAVATLLLAPWLLLTPHVAVPLAGFFFLYGLYDLNQWRKLRRYQKALVIPPRYTMRSKDIPLSRFRQFMGRGFLWRDTHVQRRYELSLPKYAHLRRLPWRYRIAQTIEWFCETRPKLVWVRHLLAWDSPLNPVRPFPKVEGDPTIHAVGLWEKVREVTFDLAGRVGHTIILGTTRVGKTRLAEIFLAQDIRRGDTVIVLDPKGDHDLLARCYHEAKRSGRLDHFYVFHLAYPEISARYNPIGTFSKITEVATRIAEQLPAQGNSAAFKEFGWRLVNSLAMAIKEMGKRPDYKLIKRYVDDIEPLLIQFGQKWLAKHGPRDWRDQLRAMETEVAEGKSLSFEEKKRGPQAVAIARLIQRVVADLDNLDAAMGGVLAWFKYDRTYADKIVSSLGPFLEKMTTGKVAELLSPDYTDLSDPRPIFDWRQVIQTNGIVYVGLAALQDATVAAAVGNSMFADLTATAGYLYARRDPGSTGLPKLKPKHTWFGHWSMNGRYGEDSWDYAPISLYADEFNELIRSNDVVQMLNKAGGAKFAITALTQTWADVEAKLQSRAMAEQVAGNLNTVIMLRVVNEDTAKIITNRLRKSRITQSMQVSGATGSSDPTTPVVFTSTTQERHMPLETDTLQPDDIMSLPKGQCFAYLEGAKLFKVILPEPLPDKSELPADLQTMTEHMRRSYTTSPDWYKDTWWDHVILKQQGFDGEESTDHVAESAEGQAEGEDDGDADQANDWQIGDENISADLDGLDD